VSLSHVKLQSVQPFTTEHDMGSKDSTITQYEKKTHHTSHAHLSGSAAAMVICIETVKCGILKR
jgi:hypothetical protein